MSGGDGQSMASLLLGLVFDNLAMPTADIG
jgi:hypothetical protein